MKPGRRQDVRAGVAELKDIATRLRQLSVDERERAARLDLLTYQLRATPPLEPTRVGTPQSREVIEGLFVSEQTLEGIVQIRVLAETNALAVRR